MAETAVDLSGEMQRHDEQRVTQGNFQKFLYLPTQISDPKEWIYRQMQNVRPWTEFVQTVNFKAPASLPRLGKRMKRNVDYFYGNYLFVCMGLIIYCLVTSPLILLALAASIYAIYYLNRCYGEKNLVIYGMTLTKSQQYGLVMICSLPIFYLVGVHGALFWVLGASFFFISVHAAFYNIDAVVPSDENAPIFEEV